MTHQFHLHRLIIRKTYILLNTSNKVKHKSNCMCYLGMITIYTSNTQCMVYFPTFITKNHPNVGTYAIRSASGYRCKVVQSKSCQLPAATPHPQGGVKIMDSLADRRIDAGAAESLWVMAPENEWLGTYFHVGARPLFRSEMLLVSVRSVPPKYHSPAGEKVAGLHEVINQ